MEEAPLKYPKYQPTLVRYNEPEEITEDDMENELTDN